MTLYKPPKQYSTDFSQPNKKPIGEVELDSEGIGKDLVFGTLLETARLGDLKTNIQPTSIEQYAQSIDNGNRGFNAVGASNQLNYDTTELIDVNTPYTIAWKGRVSGSASNDIVGTLKTTNSESLLLIQDASATYTDITWGGSGSLGFSNYRANFTELVSDLNTYMICYNGKGDSISNFKFYLNGIERTVLTSGGLSASDNLTVIANRQNGNLPFSGFLEYFFVYNKDLSAIARDFPQEVYRRTLRPKVSPVYFTHSIDSGITVTGATASYNYDGVSGSVDLTGIITVTGSTASYNYNGVGGLVDLTPEILVTGQTATYDYDGLAGNVDLSGLITVVGQTASFDYTGVDADITLQGQITVTGDTANYDYNALNGTIILQGPITFNPKNVIRVKRKTNTVMVKRKSNTIRVK